MSFFYILCALSLIWGAWIILKSIAHSVKEYNKAPWLNVPCKMSKRACRRYPMAKYK